MAGRLTLPLLCTPALALLRAKFLLESAQDLKQSLKALGSDLLVTVGLPEEVIAGVEVWAMCMKRKEHETQLKRTH